MPSEPAVPPEPSPDDPTPTPPDAARRFAAPRRLHPASVVLGVDVRQLVQAIVVPLVATIGAGGRVTLVVLALVGLVGLVGRVLAWRRFRFSFDGEVLRVTEGVVSRNHRALDIARIQQVEVDRSFVQRLMGLASLRVETAGSSSEVEVELRVIPEADARQLRAAVRESKAEASPARATSPAGEPAAEPVLRVPLRHVVLASVTGVRLLVFPAVVGGAFQLVGQAGESWIERTVVRAVRRDLPEVLGVSEITLTLGILAGALVLALSLATAIVVGVLRDAHYRIDRVDDDLHVSRGLLSTRDSVLPLRRVQLVHVHRNWLRRLLGYSAVRVHSAGGSGDADRRVTVPLLPDAAVNGLLASVYPGVVTPPALTSHPRAASRRAVLRWLRVAVVPVALVWGLPWVLPWAPLEAARWPVLALLPLAVVLGFVEYRHLAHGLDERLVSARQGALSVTTALAPVVKVQATTTRTNPFQRRLGLATLRAHVAGPGGSVEVLDAGTGDARALHDRLTRHAADPVPRPETGATSAEHEAAGDDDSDAAAPGPR